MRLSFGRDAPAACTIDFFTVARRTIRGQSSNLRRSAEQLGRLIFRARFVAGAGLSPTSARISPRLPFHLSVPAKVLIPLLAQSEFPMLPACVALRPQPRAPGAGE